MADDVKVKFGGDFSEIDKDAQSASKRIGTALGAWVGDYSKIVSTKIKDFFSVENIIGSFFGNMKESFDKMIEIDNLSKKLGVGRKELQQFGKLGKEFGIDMEMIGNSISSANKILGNLGKNKDAQKALLDFGFTIEQVNSRNIQSIDIIYKLADAYQKNKKELGDVEATNILAGQATQFFGRAGQDLNPIIKLGNEAIAERIKLMKVYSDEAIIGAKATKRAYDEGEKFVKYHFGGKQMEIIGQQVMMSYVGDLEESVSSEYKEKTGKKISQKELTKRMAERAMIERGMTPEELALAENLKSQSWFNSRKQTTHALAMQEAFTNMSEDEKRKAQSRKPEEASNIAVISSSSLQQIGGGDVSSVLAGSITQSIADNTSRTASATERIANEMTGSTPPPPNNQSK